MKRWALILGLLVLGVPATDSHAQSTLDYDVDDSVRTTAEEKRTFTADTIEEITLALESAGELVDRFIAQGEPEEVVNCARIKRDSIESLLGIVNRANSDMENALLEGDEDGASAAFRQIAVTRSKARQFLADAEGCASPGSVSGGTTNIEVVNSQGITAVDETDTTDPGDIVNPDPPSSSAYE